MHAAILSHILPVRHLRTGRAGSLVVPIAISRLAITIVMCYQTPASEASSKGISWHLADCTYTRNL
jgi:hypothetical protein